MYIIVGTGINDIYNDNATCSLSIGDLNLDKFRYLLSFAQSIENHNFPIHIFSLGI